MLVYKATICLLLASVAFADINKDHHGLLSGKETLKESHIHTLYEQFQNEFSNKPSLEIPRPLEERKSIFAKKVQQIIEHNSDSTQSYKLGINAYSDMTDEEFTSYFNIVRQEQNCSATHKQRVEKKFQLEELPSHWDWRDVNGVTPVKNQGKCGSCWTFSTIGAVESHFLIKYGQFRNLSEQQLVDCAGAYDNHGCSGGLPSHAFEYFKDIGGIATEVDYPYQAKNQQCAYNNNMANVAVVGGSVNITAHDEVELLHAIFEYGPVSVCYQVEGNFRDYKSGVYSSNTCKNSPMDVNHAVLAVGFGHQDGQDYWIVKNSWGTTFGEEGYFKIQRGVNMCGIAVCNSFPKDVIPIVKNEYIELTQ